MEKLYLKIVAFSRSAARQSTPFFRRCLRFLALPYCYFFLVNWEVCEASRLQVARDFLYIFFVMKMFPDNYSVCRLWDRDRTEWKFLYGSSYDAYQRQRLRKRVQPQEYQIIFEDKFVCRQLCEAAGFPMVRFVGRVDSNEDLVRVAEESLKDPSERLIAKPIRGKGGAGIGVLHRGVGGLVIESQGIEVPVREFQVHGPYLVEEYLQQHPALTPFSSSVNTIRILTLFTESGGALPLCATARFGRAGASVDNMSLGGIGVGVDIDTGRLFETGFDFAGRAYSVHPDSKIPFRDFILPHWIRAISLVEDVQEYFRFYGLLGHDVALKEDGPVLVEVNGAPDTASEEVNEPILLRKKNREAFQELDLLVNRLLE